MDVKLDVRPDFLTPTEKEKQALEVFLARKKTYSNQRKPWETIWEDCWKAYICDKDSKRLYEGRAKINIPVQHWKAEGIDARIIKILFNSEPYGRIEPKHIHNINENIIDMWNRYIFEHQLGEIDFKESFKLFNKIRVVLGTAVAKIPQKYETKMFKMFDDQEPKEIAIKDNPYFEPILLTEFYSDVDKLNIQDSAANIHSTSISFQELWKNRKHKVTEKETQLIVDETGEEIEITTETTKEVGLYSNLELLQQLGDGVTAEQQEYMRMLGFNSGGVEAFQRSLELIKKTGYVVVDECYGLFDINDDGIEEEVVCVIAAGTVVIRLEESPFRHKKYSRPFIVGRHVKLHNCLYGYSKIYLSYDLQLELNASRMQASDAKTKAIRHMYYINTDMNLAWDGVWRADGIIKGQGPAQSAILPIVNPHLANIGYEASQIAQTDIDQTWGLSPVQEGTSDSSKIPRTARATLAVISQNDLPLNNLIEQIAEDEVKVFFEMVYERNIQFKTVDDLLVVWSEEELAKKGFIQVRQTVDPVTGTPVNEISRDEEGNLVPLIDMKKLYFDANFKVLGNMELNNEISTQQGWITFMQMAAQMPPLVKRINWRSASEKLLGGYGIKDDIDDVFINEEIVQETERMQQEEQARQLQQQLMQYQNKVGVDTEADIKKMQVEALLESSMPNSKINNVAGGKNG